MVCAQAKAQQNKPTERQKKYYPLVNYIHSAHLALYHMKEAQPISLYYNANCDTKKNTLKPDTNKNQEIFAQPNNRTRSSAVYSCYC